MATNQHISEESKDILNSLVKVGGFPSEEEALREALKRQSELNAYYRAAIEEGEASGDDGVLNMEDIKREAQQEVNASNS